MLLHLTVLEVGPLLGTLLGGIALGWILCSGWKRLRARRKATPGGQS